MDSPITWAPSQADGSAALQDRLDLAAPTAEDRFLLDESELQRRLDEMYLEGYTDGFLVGAETVARATGE